ncbi:MAG: transcription termination/antitermination protein NusG [Spirochaetota bacterium]|nr:transcription termination/antitermination protein NusG [Spirochaetota bacterium]
MAKEWYVVHTYSGHENKVKLALEKKIKNLGLENKIYQIRIPSVDITEVKDGKRKVKSKKFFPGYIIIEMGLDDETWSVVRSTPGVTNFVGVYGSDKPKPLSKNEVDTLFDQMGQQKAKEKVSASIDFSIGEHVKVIDGPFSNFSGVIDEVYPDKGRVRVRVEIFGRGTPVELDYIQIGRL